MNETGMETTSVSTGMEGAISTRIPAPKIETYQSVKTESPLTLATVQAEPMPTTEVERVQAESLFKNTVPFIAPAVDGKKSSTSENEEEAVESKKPVDEKNEKNPEQEESEDQAVEEDQETDEEQAKEDIKEELKNLPDEKPKEEPNPAKKPENKKKKIVVDVKRLIVRRFALLAKAIFLLVFNPDLSKVSGKAFGLSKNDIPDGKPGIDDKLFNLKQQSSWEETVDRVNAMENVDAGTVITALYEGNLPMVVEDEDKKKEEKDKMSWKKALQTLKNSAAKRPSPKLSRRSR